MRVGGLGAKRGLHARASEGEEGDGEAAGLIARATCASVCTEQMRAANRGVTKATRTLDRDLRKLEMEEKKILMDVKKLAAAGQKVRAAKRPSRLRQSLAAGGVAWGVAAAPGALALARASAVRLQGAPSSPPPAGLAHSHGACLRPGRAPQK